jgi:hypothetical protein
MLGSCPNESTEEWKKIFEKAKGDRELALKMWVEEGYAENEDLNIEEGLKEESDKIGDDVNDDIDTDREASLSKLVEKIKIHINKELAILQKKKVVGQTKKQNQLKRLIENLEAVTGVESINIFVEDAYNKAKQAEARFEKILANRESKDRKTLMAELTAVSDFIKGYSILNEISKRDIREYFNGKVDPNKPKEKLTAQEMVTIAKNIKEKIESDYLEEGIPLMADFLLGYTSEDVDGKNAEEIKKLKERIDNILNDPKTSEEHKRERAAYWQEKIDKRQNFSLDKKQLIDALKMAHSDEGVLDYLISPLISSEDSVLALFAKSVKSQLESARLLDIKAKDDMAEQFETFAKTTSVSRDDKAKFNEGIYEQIDTTYKDEKTGETKVSSRMAFVQKYDISKFRKSQREIYEKLGEKPILSENPTQAEKNKLRDYNRKLGEWYSLNTDPKPKAEREEIIYAKMLERNKGIITSEEYEQWLTSVQTISPYGTIYKGELSQPSSDYINPKWKAMYNEKDEPINAKGVYHQYLLKTYLKAQEFLPDSQKPGYILPSIPKEGLERVKAKGVGSVIKQKAKEAVSVQDYETEYRLSGLSQFGVQFLPIHYTQYMAADEVSLDLAKSVLMFNSMANRYHAMNEMNAEISLFKTIIGEREVADTNTKGKPILDAFAKKLGYEEFIRQNGESYSKKHLDAFIDMVVYGEMQKAEQLFEGVSLSKLTNTLTGFSAITTIAVDLLKGVANNLQGNIQLIIEANSSEFFSKKNLRVGKGQLAAGLPGVLGDFSKSTPKSLLGKLVDRYDPLQGNFKDMYGKNVTGTAAAKLFRTNTLFFNQHFGEYEIQVSSMLALMDATMVIDNETGEEITLFQAHQKYGTGPEIHEKTNFTLKKAQAFQNRTHALSKRMHGVYNEFDKGTSQRYSLGRLAVMYRKHLVPGYKRRFKKLGMDQELGAFTEGYYRTFWNTFARDLRDYKFNIINNWSEYTPFEKAQIKRVIAELTVILSTAALIYILKAAADDDEELKNNFAYNFILYEAIRMNSETAAYISPKDAYRVVKSPSAMTSTLERGIKFVDQFMFTWDPDKLEYKRKQGIWNEGDNKSWAYFLKLMGYSGYNITPEAAVESFEGTLNK